MILIKKKFRDGKKTPEIFQGQTNIMPKTKQKIFFFQGPNAKSEKISEIKNIFKSFIYLFCFYITCGMSTAYVTSSKVIECG